jgi:hypothetical protein
MMRKAKNDSNLLHHLQYYVTSLKEEMFIPKFRYSTLRKPGKNLSEDENNVREIWRIRRFLREEKGLPLSTPPAPLPARKRQRTTPPKADSPPRSPAISPTYDPEKEPDSSVGYSPTQVVHSEDDDYDELGEDDD